MNIFIKMKLHDIKSELDNFDNYCKLVVRDPYSVTTRALLTYVCTFMDDKSKFSIPGCLLKPRRWNRDEDTEINKKIYFNLPLEGAEFKYREKNCFIKQISKGTEAPCTNEGNDMFYYTVLYIHEGTNELLQDLICESVKFYQEEVKDLAKKKDYTNIYTWDSDNMSWFQSSKELKRSIDTIYFDEGVLEGIVKDIQEFLSEEHKEIYQTFGIPYKRNYLLEGYPGTGKTSLISALASKIDYSISILHLTPKIIDSELAIVFQQIEDNTILVLEDIDCLFNGRKKSEDSMSNITFSALLNALDGMISRQNGALVFMTTNYKTTLDSALLRPGRIDNCVHFDYATEYQVKKMYTKFFPKYDLENFYKKIDTYKITVAMLQKVLLPYLFSRTDEDNEKNILTSVKKEISELVKSHQYDTDTDLKLYN
jgi:predicted AAA+ superfamily ATPase